jgi:hypothetical protein
MGDSFYHIFTTNIPIFGLCGVGIHNVISKYYCMSDITLISKKICDNCTYDILEIKCHMQNECDIKFDAPDGHFNSSYLFSNAQAENL